jgi:hypothetical protein
MIISEVSSVSVRILPSVRGTESVPEEPTTNFSFPGVRAPNRCLQGPCLRHFSVD